MLEWYRIEQHEYLFKSDEHIDSRTDISRTTPSLIDNKPLLSSKYPLSNYSSNTFNLKYNPLHVITLKNLIKEVTSVLEDKHVKIDIECWGCRGKKIKNLLLLNI